MGRCEGMYHGHIGMLFSVTNAKCIKLIKFYFLILTVCFITFCLADTDVVSVFAKSASFVFGRTLSLLSQLPALGCLFLIFSALPVVSHLDCQLCEGCDLVVRPDSSYCMVAFLCKNYDVGIMKDYSLPSCMKEPYFVKQYQN